MTATGYTGANVGMSDVDGLEAELAELGADEYRATDHGYVGWTFDPAVGVQGGTALATAGLGYVARVQAMSTVVSNIVVHLTAGGTGLTSGQCGATLHNDAGALIGASAYTVDQAAAWATPGQKPMALTVPQGVTQYAFYRVRLWFNGAVGPALARAANTDADLINAGLAAPDFRFSTADPGLTTPALAAANFGTIGTQTAAGTANWVALS